MTTLLERPGTIVPTFEDSELATEASRVLASHASDDLRVQLDGGLELTLPKSAKRLLSHLLTEMARGNAVTLIPTHAELTTKEAADILNVSRPYLIKLLTAGEIPHHMVNTHRRVRFSDLETYRGRLEEQRQRSMQELASDAQELGFGYPSV